MAGIGFPGTTITLGATSVTHLTSWNLNVQTSETSQIVADSSSALTLANPPVESVTFSFAVPASGGATLLGNLAQGTTGELVVLLKDGVGGSTLATWTSSDSNSESGGVSVTGSGNAFQIATCTVSTNGGAWT